MREGSGLEWSSASAMLSDFCNGLRSVVFFL